MCFQDYKIWRSTKTSIYTLSGGSAKTLPANTRRVGVAALSSGAGTAKIEFRDPMTGVFVQAFQRGANTTGVSASIYEWGSLITDEIRITANSGIQSFAEILLPAANEKDLCPVE